jgi:hypothetical protein
MDQIVCVSGESKLGAGIVNLVVLVVSVGWIVFISNLLTRIIVIKPFKSDNSVCVFLEGYSRWESRIAIKDSLPQLLIAGLLRL